MPDKKDAANDWLKKILAAQAMPPPTDLANLSKPDYLQSRFTWPGPRQPARKHTVEIRHTHSYEQVRPAPAITVDDLSDSDLFYVLVIRMFLIWLEKQPGGVTLPPPGFVTPEQHRQDLAVKFIGEVILPTRADAYMEREIKRQLDSLLTMKERYVTGE